MRFRARCLLGGVEGEELAVQEDRIELKREAVDASGQAGAQEGGAAGRRVHKLECTRELGGGCRSMGMTRES